MKILFCGDVCCNSTREGLCDTKLESFIRSHDYSFVNFEGPVCEGKASSTKVGPYKCNSKSITNALMNAGFNAVTLANNHIMDFGISGLRNTLNEIRPLIHVGAGTDVDSVYKPCVLKENDFTVAIYSIAEKQFGACGINDKAGFAWMFSPLFFNSIRECCCDIKIVVCHCGLEELDVPLPELRCFYRELVDAGADLIVGHHPHVIQGMEIYKGKSIYYSLGNFIFENDDGTAYNPVGAILSADINRKSLDSMLYEIVYDKQIVGFKGDNNEFEMANKRMNSEEYESIVDDFCKEFFEQYYLGFIANSIGLNLNNKINLQKFVEYRLKGIPLKYNKAWLYHNTVIESNRWALEHAIGSLF